MLWCSCVMYKNTSVINIRHCDNATKSSLFFCFREARRGVNRFCLRNIGAVSNSIAVRNSSLNKPGYHIAVWKCTMLFLLIATVMNDYQGLLTYYRRWTMNFKLACQKVYVTWELPCLQVLQQVLYLQLDPENESSNTYVMVVTQTALTIS